MLFSRITVATLFGSVSAASFKKTEHDRLAELGLKNLERDVAKNGYPQPQQCTLKNAAIRREWYAPFSISNFSNGIANLLHRSQLSKSEKLNYIDAIQCIHKKPALTPAAIAAGAKSRYDDFVVTHVKQTYEVHGTVRLPAVCLFCVGLR
jgi:tyrosinase